MPRTSPTAPTPRRRCAFARGATTFPPSTPSAQGSAPRTTARTSSTFPRRAPTSSARPNVPVGFSRSISKHIPRGAIARTANCQCRGLSSTRRARATTRRRCFQARRGRTSFRRSRPTPSGLRGATRTPGAATRHAQSMTRWRRRPPAGRMPLRRSTGRRWSRYARASGHAPSLRLRRR